MAKLSERELVCAEVLVGKGRSLRQVARELGVDESTLRYRLARRRAGAVDGRTKQHEACAPFEDAIAKWIEAQDWSGQSERPASVRGLYDDLVRDHGFSGSYKSVVRFVRRRAPSPAVRPARRVETGPGAQAQADWATRKVFVHELGGVTPLQTFLMPLSHARFTAMRFYPDATMLWWLDAHNRAFETFGGVPLTVRIDNLKTGVKRGAGPWAVLNDTYDAYARELGFVVDPARPAKGNDKRWALAPRATPFLRRDGGPSSSRTRRAPRESAKRWPSNPPASCSSPGPWAGTGGAHETAFFQKLTPTGGEEFAVLFEDGSPPTASIDLEHDRPIVCCLAIRLARYDRFPPACHPDSTPAARRAALGGQGGMLDALDSHTVVRAVAAGRLTQRRAVSLT